MLLKNSIVVFVAILATLPAIQVTAAYKTLPNVTGFSKDGDGGLIAGKKMPQNATKCDSF